MRSKHVHISNVPRAVSLFLASFAILVAIKALAQVPHVGPSRTSTDRLTQQNTFSSLSNSPLFLPAVTYGTGGFYASSVAAADLNGDGNQDLVIANCAPSGSSNCDGNGIVGVLLGNNDGSFQAAVTYSSGGFDTRSVVVADVNADGKPDVVMAHDCLNSSGCPGGEGPGAVSVLLGNGDGTLRPAVTYNSGGYNAESVAVADVNSDGEPDLIVGNFVSPGDVAVLLGNGDGTFKPARTLDVGGVWHPSVAVGDLNRDGRPDLVMAVGCLQAGPACSTMGGTSDGGVSVLVGNGDGTFRPAMTYDSGGLYANWVDVADVNGDGHLDLLVANYFSDTAGVLLGNGDGTFQSARAYNTGGGAGTKLTSVKAADVNGDRKLDILATNYLSDIVGVLLGNGDGTFQSAVTYSASETYLSSVIVVDVNGDHKPDLLVGGAYGNENSGVGSVAVLRNNFSKNPTATALASSLNPSIYGQTVTFTAKVIASGPVPPTGTVIFMWKYFTTTYTIGTATLNSAGVATLAKSNLNAGQYPMIAVYRGDNNNLRSTSAVVNQTVQQTTSAAVLTSSVNPSTVGQAITFSAKMTSPTVTPSGPVTFKAGTTVLGTAQLSSGRAIFSTSTLPAGSSVVKVIYNGNSNIKGSSASVVQTVQP